MDKLCQECPHRAGVPVQNTLSRKGHRTLAAVAIYRNEEYLLNEWIPFHILAGVEHIYLYDDRSQDRSNEIVQKYVDQGLVTLIPWSDFINVNAAGSPKRLTYAYAHAIATFGHLWRWMTFIDLDEFLFSRKGNLVEALADYSDLPAIIIPWYMFGTNGFKKRPSGLVIENFTKRMPFPPEPDTFPKLFNWKSIVDPMEVIRIVTPHIYQLRNNRVFGYTENKEPVDRRSFDIWKSDTKIFQLNHYFTLSEEDFYARRDKGHNFEHVGSYMDYEKAKKERLHMLAESTEKSRVQDDEAGKFSKSVRLLIGR